MSNVVVESPKTSRFRQLRAVLKVVVPLLLFVGALLALAGGGQQLLQYRIAIAPGLAVASFAVLLWVIVWASLVWTYMARLFGAPLDWRSGVKVYATSNLGKYLPGK